MKQLIAIFAAVFLTACAPLMTGLSTLGPTGPRNAHPPIVERCWDAEAERMTAEACR